MPFARKGRRNFALGFSRYFPVRISDNPVFRRCNSDFAIVVNFVEQNFDFRFEIIAHAQNEFVVFNMQYFKFGQIIAHRYGNGASRRASVGFGGNFTFPYAYGGNRTVVIYGRDRLVRRSPFYVFVSAVKTYNIQFVAEYHIRGRDGQRNPTVFGVFRIIFFPAGIVASRTADA